MTEHFYRVYESNYVDGKGNSEIFIQALPVLRHTAHGIWVNDYGDHKFVLKDRGKFAAPTVEKAIAQFIRRKELHLKFLAARHDRIAKVLETAKQKDFSPANLARVQEMLAEHGRISPVERL